MRHSARQVGTRSGWSLQVILSGLLVFALTTLLLLGHHLYTSFPAVYKFSVVPGCSIPQFDPFDPATKQYVRKQSPLRCGEKPWLTKTVQDEILVDRDLLARNGESLVKCEYRVIERKTDDEVGFTEPVVFSYRARLAENVEFLEAKCVAKTASGKEKEYRTYHHVVKKKPVFEEELQKRLSVRTRALQRARQQIKQANMSVMLIGMDSVSRFSTIRLMPNFRQYLLDDLQAIEITNYNKVGDNTFPNILGLTTGRKVDEDSEDMLSHIGVITKRPMDKQGLQFIWKDFEEQGYMTMFIEDFPTVGTFNWNKGSGFESIPTHYYYRPMELAKELQSNLFTHHQKCFAGFSNDVLLLNYTVDLYRLVKRVPRFSITYLTAATHGDINGASSVEGYHLDFVQTLKREGLLDNTLLLYFSDHGIRGKRGFGRTPLRKFEEMRPFMFLAFPQWFREAHPDLIKNVRKNSDRLATHFDIHSTLLDVLFLGLKDPHEGQRKTVHGISLFDEIPIGRTCVDAGIPLPYCVCLKERPLLVDSAQALEAGTALIAALNAAQNSVRDKCHTLTLHNVTDFAHVDGGGRFLDIICDGFLPDKALYRVTVTAQPSQAVFEGTLSKCSRFSPFELQGEVGRLNLYGNTSHCVKYDRILKKICYCKDL